MALMQMNYELAMAIATDGANRQMRKAGRTKWSIEDRNEAARLFWVHFGNDALEPAAPEPIEVS